MIGTPLSIASVAAASSGFHDSSCEPALAIGTRRPRSSWKTTQRRASVSSTRGWAAAASTGRRAWPKAVMSKPIDPSRIASTSRIAASSSTTRTSRVTGARASLLLSAALQTKVDLLQPLEVGLTLGEVLAEPRDLPLEGEDRRQRVPAHPGAPRLGAVAALREIRVVRRHRRGVVALLSEAVGLRELRRTPQRPWGQGRAAAGEEDHERGDRDRPQERGRSTVKRLPFPSCDSAVTRPPWASAMPRTIARPRPVPPRSWCAWR